MEDIKRILVVSRMTKCCRKTLHYGVSLSQKYGADLFVMHALHNPFGLEGWNLPMVSMEEDYKRELQKAKKELDALVKKEIKAGMSVQELVLEGEPTEAILKTVQKEKIDLLIMTAHEEGRLEHFLFGQSNDEITRRMPCTVLLVKEHLKTVRF